MTDQYERAANTLAGFVTGVKYISLFLNNRGQVTPHEMPLMSYSAALDQADDDGNEYAGTIEINELTGACRFFQMEIDRDGDVNAERVDYQIKQAKEDRNA